MFELAFDPDTHSYTVDGVALPSVTQVLAPLYDFRYVDRDVLKAAADFGTAVHRMCELHDVDDLVEDSVDPALEPYLVAWQRFLRETRAEVLQVEQRYHHPLLRFAGTLDRLLKIDGAPVLVDIKTVSSLSAAVGVQLAAYEHLLAENTPHQGVRRAAVRLCGDGTYRLKFFTDAMDWPTFASLLTLQNWRRKHAA